MEEFATFSSKTHRMAIDGLATFDSHFVAKVTKRREESSRVVY